MIILVLILLGLTLGSFANAVVWRLHEQAHRPKKSKAKKSTKSLPTTDQSLSIARGRSVCVNCRHQLDAADLVPVFSWLALGGKCRYCRKPISPQYPLVELATAALFVFSYNYWPHALAGLGLIQFVVWLIMLVGFVILFVYDIRWFLLPNKVVYPLIVLSILLALTGGAVNGFSALIAALWGLVVVGGIFYFLFVASDGKWIGGGDVKLGILLGLLVGGPMAGLLVLFLASLVGTVYALPMMVAGKAGRRTRVPFGPFLIIAAVVTYLFGTQIVGWYLHLYL